MNWHLSKQAVNDLAIGDGGGTRESREVGSVRIDPEGVVNRGGDVFRSPGASDGDAAVAVGGWMGAQWSVRGASQRTLRVLLGVVILVAATKFVLV